MSTLEEKYRIVRTALVGIVGTDDPEALNRFLLQANALPPEERTTIMGGINALLSTQETGNEGNADQQD